MKPLVLLNSVGATPALRTLSMSLRTEFVAVRVSIR